MAFETEQGNAARVTDVISDAISAALVERVVVAPLVYTEDLPQGTNVKKFRKDGSLTAEAVAESGTYSFSGSSELTQTSVSATAIKTAVASKLTVEAEQFSDLDISKLAREQGAALARAIDDEILALFDGFSTQVTSTTVLTVDDLMTACYNVFAGNAGGAQTLVGVLDHKGAHEIRKEIANSSASIWSQESLTTLLRGAQEAANGYVGAIPGLELYATSGLPTDSSDDVGLVFNPMLAIAGMVSPSVNVRTSWEGSAGGYTEVYSYIFSDFVEWNDAAGCGVLSDS